MLLHYRSKIVVGFAIKNDFKSLRIEESELGDNVVRDVQTHYKERRCDVDFSDCHYLPDLKKHENYSLKTLAFLLLHEDVQRGGVQHHDAVEDAKITMKLYRFDELAFDVNAHLWDVD